MSVHIRAFSGIIIGVLFCLGLSGSAAQGGIDFSAEGSVSSAGAAIDVPGYSVPCTGDLTGDGINDLVVGEGGGGVSDARVRIYENTGTADEPYFPSFSYAQTGMGDLILPGSGCMGCFPRVVFWDTDNLPDLLIGRSDGTVSIHFNIGTSNAAAFTDGVLLHSGMSGFESAIDVGARATPSFVDWNSDGLPDLVSGSLDGMIRIFINDGEVGQPHFTTQTFAISNGAPLDVPGNRSSPAVLDLDGDAKKDLLVGNTNGEIVLYRNTGTDAAPKFSGYEYVKADGARIDLAGWARARPFAGDWDADGVPDLLVGGADGRVHLYTGSVAGDVNADGCVNVADLLMTRNALGQSGSAIIHTGADTNSDGVVNVADLLFVRNSLGDGPGC